MYSFSFLKKTKTLKNSILVLSIKNTDIKGSRMSLKEEFIELLQTDKEFRTKVHNLLQETISTKDNIQLVLLQIKQLREDFQKEMKQQHEEFQKEMKQQHEEFQKEMKQQRIDTFTLFERVDLKLEALGARWV